MLARVSIQMATQIESTQETTEEEKSAFAQVIEEDDNNPIVSYKAGCFTKASSLLKQTFGIALGLNDLESLRESLYLLSIVSNSLLKVNSNETAK